MVVPAPYRESTRLRGARPEPEERPQPVGWPEGPIGKRNVVWGWVFICMGAISGSVIGAWSFTGPFPAPAGFEHYEDLPRRMLRLAHVAMFMLPIINILIGKELDGIALSPRWKRITSTLALVAMLGIPGGLVLGAAIHPLLWYLASGPATCLLCALVLMAFGKVRAARAS